MTRRRSASDVCARLEHFGPGVVGPFRPVSQRGERSAKCPTPTPNGEPTAATPKPMKFSLAQMASRAGVKRRTITFRPIMSTNAHATDLARILKRMITPWLNAQGRLLEAYQYELQRRLYTDSADDLTALFESLGAEVTRLVVELTPSLREWALRVERWHRTRWLGTVLSGAGVDLSTTLGPADAKETVDAFLARNAALVKDISSQAQGRISDAVFRGLQMRTPPRQVGKDIAAAVGMARKRADRIAADQAVKISSALDQERRRQAGLDTWRWHHSFKKHPRPEHVARNGKLYTDERAPADRPGELPFCGCVAQAVLVLDGEVLG